MSRAWIWFTSAMLLVCTGATAPAAESYFSGRAESADGTQIAYESWGEGSPALVFVHGWSCDRGYWREQVSSFKRSHQVVAIDLAGHGQSGSDRTDYSMESFGADVIAVLVEANLDDVILVGHSMGGPVMVEAALAVPDRVRGLIGVDNFQSIAAEIPPGQIDAFLGAMRKDFPGVVAPWVGSMFPDGADSALASQVAADMASGDPTVGVSAMSHVLPWMGGGGAARVQELQVNLVTISSDLHPTDIEANRELIPRFDARIIAGVGHFLMLEDATEFNRLLAEAVAGFETQ